MEESCTHGGVVHSWRSRADSISADSSCLRAVRGNEKPAWLHSRIFSYAMAPLFVRGALVCAAGRPRDLPRLPGRPRDLPRGRVIAQSSADWPPNRRACVRACVCVCLLVCVLACQQPAQVR